MSHGQFLFFTPNRGNEDHLKAEINNRWPNLKLSFSRPGFVTYKNTGEEFTLDQLSQLHFAFSRTHGICLGPSNKEDYLKDIENFSNDYSIASYNLHHWNRKGDEIKSDINENADFIFDVINIDKEKIWLGLHIQSKQSNRSPGGFPGIELPQEAPSRAYLKIAEIVESYNLPIQKEDNILDIGCAPGGASYYFLEKCHRVIGIDPGDMDDICLQSPLFKHLKFPVQKVSKKEIKENIDWITLDLNLKAGLSLKEGIRLAKEYPNLKGLAYTVKMPTTDLCERIDEFVNKFKVLKFKNLVFGQVPTHKKEFAVIAYN
jgi:23S rRNA U2552 (ribose-2'-O)-methylase RlmE/FtsJ